jgi:hypothetical protein
LYTLYKFKGKASMEDIIKQVTKLNYEWYLSKVQSFKTEACYNKDKDLIKGDLVIIAPSETPKFRVELVPIDPEACNLKYAYFGTIRKAN